MPPIVWYVLGALVLAWAAVLGLFFVAYRHSAHESEED